MELESDMIGLNNNGWVNLNCVGIWEDYFFVFFFVTITEKLLLLLSIYILLLL